MLDLLNTPSSGVDETLEALLQAHAYGGRYVDANHLHRLFPPHVALNDIDEVLTSETAANHVEQGTGANAGGYTLTQAGVVYARQNKPRRSRVDIDV